MSDPFGKRLRRAEFLQKEWPFAADLLQFHARILSLQKEMLTKPGEEPLVTRLQSLVQLHGPPELARLSARPGLVGAYADYRQGKGPEDPFLEFCHRVEEQVRLLLGHSGWEADAALTWWTYGAVLALVAAIVIELRGTALGVLVSMALLTTGSAITGIVLTASRLRGYLDVSVLRVLIPWRQDIQTVAPNAPSSSTKSARVMSSGIRKSTPSHLIE